jgi:hypothetical protein
MSPYRTWAQGQLFFRRLDAGSVWILGLQSFFKVVVDKWTLIYAAFPMAFSLLRIPVRKIHEETAVCWAASPLYSKLKSPSYGCCSEISELGFPIEVATGFAARVCLTHIR